MPFAPGILPMYKSLAPNEVPDIVPVRTSIPLTYALNVSPLLVTAIACHVLSAYKFVWDDVRELPAELILVLLLVIVIVKGPLGPAEDWS